MSESADLLAFNRFVPLEIDGLTALEKRVLPDRGLIANEFEGVVEHIGVGEPQERVVRHVGIHDLEMPMGISRKPWMDNRIELLLAKLLGEFPADPCNPDDEEGRRPTRITSRWRLRVGSSPTNR